MVYHDHLTSTMIIHDHHSSLVIFHHDRTDVDPSHGRTGVDLST